MANSLLQQATQDTALMNEVAEAVKSAFPGVSLKDAADIQAFAAKVESNPVSLASLKSSLNKIALEKNLTPINVLTSLRTSAAQLEVALANYVLIAQRRGIQVPAEVMAAILIFEPILLSTSE